MGVLLKHVVKINQWCFASEGSVKHKWKVEVYGYNQVHHMLLLVS